MSRGRGGRGGRGGRQEGMRAVLSALGGASSRGMGGGPEDMDNEPNPLVGGYGDASSSSASANTTAPPKAYPDLARPALPREPDARDKELVARAQKAREALYYSGYNLGAEDVAINLPKKRHKNSSAQASGRWLEAYRRSEKRKIGLDLVDEIAKPSPCIFPKELVKVVWAGSLHSNRKKTSPAKERTQGSFMDSFDSFTENLYRRADDNPYADAAGGEGVKTEEGTANAEAEQDEDVEPDDNEEDEFDEDDEYGQSLVDDDEREDTGFGEDDEAVM
eukprot:g59165.t1